jgi:TetR/AcrR family transcriptional regulator, transcriptional repressor for nem operon
MLRYGYAATAVDEICAKAGVTKGSFYHFFETKEELGLAVLDAFYEQGAARVLSGKFAEANDPYQRLRGLFDHLETIGPEIWRHGCLIGNFACEHAESSQLIRRRVARMFEELANRLAPVFQPIARDGREAIELAEQTLMVIEGAVIMARAYDDPRRIASGLRQFRRMVEARIEAMRPLARKAHRGRSVRPRNLRKENSHG